MKTLNYSGSFVGMKHQGEELCKVYINHDPGMTLTYFTARSTLVAHAFELGKLSKCHLKGKTLWKWANGQKIYDSEKNGPQGQVCPHPRAIYMYIAIIFKDFLL